MQKPTPARAALSRLVQGGRVGSGFEHARFVRRGGCLRLRDTGREEAAACRTTPSAARGRFSCDPVHWATEFDKAATKSRLPIRVPLTGSSLRRARPRAGRWVVVARERHERDVEDSVADGVARQPEPSTSSGGRGTAVARSAGVSAQGAPREASRLTGVGRLGAHGSRGRHRGSHPSRGGRRRPCGSACQEEGLTGAWRFLRGAVPGSAREAGGPTPPRRERLALAGRGTISQGRWRRSGRAVTRQRRPREGQRARCGRLRAVRAGGHRLAGRSAPSRGLSDRGGCGPPAGGGRVARLRGVLYGEAIAARAARSSRKACIATTRPARTVQTHDTRTSRSPSPSRLAPRSRPSTSTREP
jgi:hypothetical protein